MSINEKIYSTLLIAIFLIIASQANAQLSLGFRGGANATTMDFTNNPEFRLQKPLRRLGFQGGLFLQYSNSPHVGLQGEFNFTQKGWAEATNTTTNTQYQRLINYFEFVTLTHIFIGKGKFRFIINIGPYAAYALNATEWTKDMSSGIEVSNPYVFNDGDDNRLDYGLLAGAGVEYVFSFGTIHLEGRYSMGLGNISNIKTTASELSQNRVISITIGYAYNFRKKEKKTKPKKDLQ